MALCRHTKVHAHKRGIGHIIQANEQHACYSRESCEAPQDQAQANQGRQPPLFHYRESRGIEIDLLVEYGLALNQSPDKTGELMRALAKS